MARPGKRGPRPASPLASRLSPSHAFRPTFSAVTSAPPHAADPALRRAAIVVATLGAFLTPFTSSAVNLALPTIGRTFGASAVTLGWISTVNILAAAALVVPFSRLADLHGRRRVFLIGVVGVHGWRRCGRGWSPSIGQLIAARAVAGRRRGGDVRHRGGDPRRRCSLRGARTGAGPQYRGGLPRPLPRPDARRMADRRLRVAVGLPRERAGRRGAPPRCRSGRLRGEWAGARGSAFDLVGAVLYVATQLALLLGLSRLTTPGGAAVALAGIARAGDLRLVGGSRVAAGARPHPLPAEPRVRPFQPRGVHQLRGDLGRGVPRRVSTCSSCAGFLRRRPGSCSSPSRS